MELHDPMIHAETRKADMLRALYRAEMLGLTTQHSNKRPGWLAHLWGSRGQRLATDSTSAGTQPEGMEGLPTV
jgi:hypothetical protein